MRELPVSELIDVDSIRRDGRKPTPKQIREALPAGWALDEDGETAFRDGRIFFRDAWVMMLGLISFGAAGLGLFWFAFPSGFGAVLRFVVTTLIVLLAGGLIAPVITRALNRRR